MDLRFALLVVPPLEMACGVDLGSSILEGSGVLANWATDIGGAEGGGGGDEVGEAEDVFGAIAGGGGSGGTVSIAAPALACITGFTGEGRNGEAVIVLVAVLVSRGVKLILSSLNFLILVLP